MNAYETAQAIAFTVVVVLGLAGLGQWMMIVSFAMIATAAVHALTEGEDL